jgi:hypothetical protein
MWRTYGACWKRFFNNTITFHGERRPTTGAPVLTGTVRAKSVAGEATGLEGEGKFQGEAFGRVEADRVEPGGIATGLKWKTR